VPPANKRSVEVSDDGINFRIIDTTSRWRRKPSLFPLRLPNTFLGSTPEMAQADVRESVSVAHLYGQNVVKVESLTAFGMGGDPWSYGRKT
jgi:hypothetical protein